MDGRVLWLLLLLLPLNVASFTTGKARDLRAMGRLGCGGGWNKMELWAKCPLLCGGGSKRG